MKDADKGDGAMFGWGPNASWWWMTLVWSFGGHLYDEQLLPSVDTPEAILATRYFKDMLSYGPEGGISATGDDVANKFLSTNVGAMMQYSGYWGMALDPANNLHAGKIGTARTLPDGISGFRRTPKILGLPGSFLNSCLASRIPRHSSR
ncbi:MAG: extracellular solute-binding protein [Mesorhizobium sp.]|nr:MAG: extracellular solute-binding protein [Mesorhizobium sp.]TIV11812.1 MAG: extracellular solute-binding protein [Mesorhizobium sp.]